MTATTATDLTIPQIRTLDAQHGEQLDALDFIVAIGGRVDQAGPHYWACGADLAQWGTFRRGEYVTRDIAWTLRLSEQGVGYGPGSDPVLAQRFDY